MSAWVTKENKSFHVSYKAGYAPASTSTTSTTGGATTVPATTSAG